LSVAVQYAKRGDTRVPGKQVEQRRAAVAGFAQGQAVGGRRCTQCGSANSVRAKFCGECGAALAEQPAPVATGFGAERRQLTVMFCDLVDSTNLSTRVDPEDLARIIRAYRSLVQEEVARLGGYVARLFGDGILVYFGYPAAREDDASRAIRAALNIVRGMPMITENPDDPASRPLEAHIGIHTGLVLVEGNAEEGTLFDKSGIIGETPNLAARIESLAPANTVLVSAATQALTARFFQYQLFGEVQLRGFRHPVRVFQPLAEWDWRRALQGGDATPLVGRERELAMLEEGWQRAMSGSGRAVAISGDPGIGKTRLASWLAARVRDSGGVCFQLFCDPDAEGSAFRPVIEAITRYLSLARRPGPRGLKLVSRLIAAAGVPPHRSLPVLSDWLSLGPDPAGAAGRMMPEARRRRLLSMMVDWLSHLSDSRPVLLVVENLHWADASTQEWLDELVQTMSGMRLLLVATYRPGFVPVWYPQPEVIDLPVDRLSAAEVETMLDRLCADHPLLAETRAQVVAKCDGVPMFVEELIKMLAEHPDIEPAEQEVPTALRDMLAARLDRLGPTREVARAASVIGRQFSYNLLRSLLPSGPQELEHGLSHLVEADIIRPTGAGLDATFAFKHALLQDAAYGSLLRPERRAYHRRLMQAYRTQYARLVETEPEIIARHASAAALYDQALPYWWNAGQRARSRSAYREALGHFRRGLADAERVAPGGDATEIIRFCAAIATTAMAAEGFAAPEVERMSTRARALISSGTEIALTSAVLGGLNSYYQVRGPLRLAAEICQRQIDLAAGTGDPAQILGAQRRMGWCQFCRGDMRTGRRLLRSALVYYRTQPVPAAGRLTETDTGVVGLVNLGWVECFLGDLDGGEALCAESRERARILGRLPMDSAYALCMSAAAAQLRGDVAQVLAQSAEALEIATTNALPYWQAWAGVLHGWAMSHATPAPGLARIEDGIAAYRATGARLFVPYSLALAAETCLRLGTLPRGLALVEQGLAEAEEIDAHFIDAELLRLRAELLRRAGSGKEAVAALGDAAALAASQGAVLFQQRAERLLGDITQDCV
jgi:class 3 adenylate cyclase